MKKSFIGIIALVGLLLYGFYDYMNKEPLDTADSAVEIDDANISVGVEKGNRAPDFELMNLVGEQVSLSDYSGQKVLINFWATWCPPCRAEMPHMQEFYEDYKEEGVVILGVNMTTTEKNHLNVAPFVEEYGLTFPILLDTEGDVLAAYQLVAFPTTFVLDEKGVIQEKFQGAIHYEIMEQAIEF